MNPKSTLTDKRAQINEARDRYNNRRNTRPKQQWVCLLDSFGIKRCSWVKEES